MAHQLKVGMIQEMRDVGLGACKIIIGANNFMPLCQKPFTEV
jgi:hypothetical protein